MMSLVTSVRPKAVRSYDFQFDFRFNESMLLCVSLYVRKNVFMSKPAVRELKTARVV